MVDSTRENIWLGRSGNMLVVSGGVVGTVCLAGAILLAWSRGEPGAFFLSYLCNYMYFLSLALGGLFVLLLGHLVHAAWSVVVRRLKEWIVASMPWLALLFIPVLLGVPYLYPWAQSQPQVAGHLQELLAWKRPYLNIPAFSIRVLIYFLAWLWMGWYYLRQSTKQDSLRDLDSSVAVTRRMERLAAPAMLVFAVTITFAAVDWLMSRDPFWYSTIYGVYYFSGSVVGGFALLTTMVWLVQISGRLRQTVTADHYQDLGKYVFGFIVFWGYIAFSQYMLIWYGNIPEETEWYLRRITGQWRYASIGLVVGHFLIPFFALISRYPKRRPAMLVTGCLWVLAMHWFDVYWLTMPESSPGVVPLSWLDLLTFAGIGGFCVTGATLWQCRQPLVPVSDPRLGESLRFENA